MRKREYKLSRKGHCDEMWGTHICYKQKGHLGKHFCSNRCVRKDNVLDMKFPKRGEA